MSRRPRTTRFWMGRLPHWEVEDGRYFITLHTSGAIPAAGRDRLRSEAARIRSIEDTYSVDWLRLQRRIFGEMEKWLDRGEWNAHLRRSDVAEMVVEAIEHRSRRGDWNVFEYVLMPTHLHMFCEIGRHGLKKTMEDFKRWTGHRAKALVNGQGKRFWQREWFDHWSRSEEQDERIVQYIRSNPVKAGLVTEFTDWPYGGWNRSIERT